jgi:hypothetical protein
MVIIYYHPLQKPTEQKAALSTKKRGYSLLVWIKLFYPQKLPANAVLKTKNLAFLTTLFKIRKINDFKAYRAKNEFYPQFVNTY